MPEIPKRPRYFKPEFTDVELEMLSEAATMPGRETLSCPGCWREGMQTSKLDWADSMDDTDVRCPRCGRAATFTMPDF